MRFSLFPFTMPSPRYHHQACLAMNITHTYLWPTVTTRNIYRPCWELETPYLLSKHLKEAAYSLDLKFNLSCEMQYTYRGDKDKLSRIKFCCGQIFIHNSSMVIWDMIWMGFLKRGNILEIWICKSLWLVSRSQHSVAMLKISPNMANLK